MIWQGVDWAKADIYSLAKTCLFTLSGEIVEDASELINADDINEHIKSILFRMLSENPMDRPEIEELIQIIK